MNFFHCLPVFSYLSFVCVVEFFSSLLLSVAILWILIFLRLIFIRVYGQVALVFFSSSLSSSFGNGAMILSADIRLRTNAVVTSSMSKCVQQYSTNFSRWIGHTIQLKNNQSFCCNCCCVPFSLVRQNRRENNNPEKRMENEKLSSRFNGGDVGFLCTHTHSQRAFPQHSFAISIASIAFAVFKSHLPLQHGLACI